MLSLREAEDKLLEAKNARNLASTHLCGKEFDQFF
jgi:hypothetical protein